MLNILENKDITISGSRNRVQTESLYSISKMINKLSLVVLLFGSILLGFVRGDGTLQITEEDITILVGENGTVGIKLLGTAANESVIHLSVNHKDLVGIPNDIKIEPGITSWTISFSGLDAGHAILNISLDEPGRSEDDGKFVRITIQHNEAINLTSIIIGWIYFAAWSISFYPQIFQNWTRKSVVGLNFDFVSLNIVGFILYSLFNCGLYWIPVIEEEYMRRFPRGLNPVQVNDIVFSLHASLATLFMIVQCFIYERGNQKISWTARVIHGAFTMFLFISVILAWTEKINWLDFLYYCSYVKLAISLIKYIPQAYMNYKRKSTEGWSIGNIFLDFTGGMLSMLQMILNAYNYNDWESIFGDPTKFGLGLFSVVFDVFFIIQHYVLYSRHPMDRSPYIHPALAVRIHFYREIKR